MNYRDYQQVMKLSVGKKETPSSSTSSSSLPTRVSSPLSSPLSSPKLHPHCASSANNNYKIQKKPKITRSKTGCLCCRRRRKKCDEVHPKCGGCTRNFLDCCWPSVVASPQALNVSDDDSVPASFSLNNNIMIIQDEQWVTQTSKEKSGDTNFVISLMKSTSGMKERFNDFPKAISVRSLLN